MYPFPNRESKRDLDSIYFIANLAYFAVDRSLYGQILNSITALRRLIAATPKRLNHLFSIS